MSIEAIIIPNVIIDEESDKHGRIVRLDLLVDTFRSHTDGKSDCDVKHRRKMDGIIESLLTYDSVIFVDLLNAISQINNISTSIYKTISYVEESELAYYLSRHVFVRNQSEDEIETMWIDLDELLTLSNYSLEGDAFARIRDEDDHSVRNKYLERTSLSGVNIRETALFMRTVLHALSHYDEKVAFTGSYEGDRSIFIDWIEDIMYCAQGLEIISQSMFDLYYAVEEDMRRGFLNAIYIVLCTVFTHQLEMSEFQELQLRILSTLRRDDVHDNFTLGTMVGCEVLGSVLSVIKTKFRSRVFPHLFYYIRNPNEFLSSDRINPIMKHLCRMDRMNAFAISMVAVEQVETHVEGYQYKSNLRHLTVVRDTVFHSGSDLDFVFNDKNAFYHHHHGESFSPDHWNLFYPEQTQTAQDMYNRYYNVEITSEEELIFGDEIYIDGANLYLHHRLECMLDTVFSNIVKGNDIFCSAFSSFCSVPIGTDPFMFKLYTDIVSEMKVPHIVLEIYQPLLSYCISNCQRIRSSSREVVCRWENVLPVILAATIPLVSRLYCKYLGLDSTMEIHTLKSKMTMIPPDFIGSVSTINVRTHIEKSICFDFVHGTAFCFLNLNCSSNFHSIKRSIRRLMRNNCAPNFVILHRQIHETKSVGRYSRYKKVEEMADLIESRIPGKPRLGHTEYKIDYEFIYTHATCENFRYTEFLLHLNSMNRPCNIRSNKCVLHDEFTFPVIDLIEMTPMMVALYGMNIYNWYAFILHRSKTNDNVFKMIGQYLKFTQGSMNRKKNRLYGVGPRGREIERLPLDHQPTNYIEMANFLSFESHFLMFDFTSDEDSYNINPNIVNYISEHPEYVDPQSIYPAPTETELAYARHEFEFNLQNKEIRRDKCCYIHNHEIEPSVVEVRGYHGGTKLICTPKGYNIFNLVENKIEVKDNDKVFGYCSDDVDEDSEGTVIEWMDYEAKDDEECSVSNFDRKLISVRTRDLSKINDYQNRIPIIRYLSKVFYANKTVTHITPIFYSNWSMRADARG